MLWVFVRSIITTVYDSALDGDASVDWVGVLVTWIVVVAYCASNAMFLRVMHLRSMVSERGYACRVRCCPFLQPFMMEF